MSDRTPPPRSVLIVEDQAHVAAGHFSVRFAELAAALVELGCTVDVLTSRGWAATAAGSPPFTVHRYGRIARAASAAADRIPGSGGHRVARVSRGLRSIMRTLVAIGAARSMRRRLPGPARDVIVLSFAIEPVVAAWVAGPGRWFQYVFVEPRAPLRMVRLFRASAGRAEVRRQRAGGRFSLAMPSEELGAVCARRAPFLDRKVMPIAGVRRVTPITDARAQLGLALGERIALVFGSHHGRKDLMVIWRAFAALPSWRLLIVGGVADSYGGAGSPKAALGPVLRAGFVDERTRDLAYAATDALVVSFHPDHRRDSGTLMDAIARGVPVVCSARSVAAGVVTEHHLGVLFEPGDAASLIDAMARVPAQLDPDDVARARRELSNTEVARRCLAILGAVSGGARGAG